ncbi:hypothetical protein A4A49_17826 [Nicotiana attenuata]|uniref:Uncharacterized protein n=1 Tax=Nicotiana attenuata TaxID=49451 RepID=A0A314LE73_NICAT|nr:hypothetical protein A4A49_17826 [Nicotiana attenuata]
MNRSLSSPDSDYLFILAGFEDIDPTIGVIRPKKILQLLKQEGKSRGAVTNQVRKGSLTYSKNHRVGTINFYHLHQARKGC